MNENLTTAAAAMTAALADPAGAPSHPAIFLVLGVVTFALHIAAVSILLGSTGLALFARYKATDYWLRLGSTMAFTAKAAETAAKDITEDVAQIDSISAKAAEAARTAAVLGCITGINTGKAVLIVQLALFRVRKHLVGFIDFLELFLGILIAGVIVRVVLHGQLAVSLFDLRIGGRFGYSQHFVVIALFLCHNHTSIKPAKAAPAKPERLLLLSGTPARRFGRASAVCVRP